MFDALPDAARLWIFPLDRSLDAAEAGALAQAVAGWLPTWRSHGRPVAAGVEVLAGRALAVGAVISQAEASRQADAVNAGVSGCGIDAMERAVADALGALGVGLAPPLGVLYRGADGGWQSAPRPAFRRRVREGAAGPETPILDVTPQTVGALRASGPERPAGETWAARAFGMAPTRA